MKKLGRFLSLLASPFVIFCTFLVGCFFHSGTGVTGEVSIFMHDKDKEPDFDPEYKEYSEAALNAYYAVANNHIVDEEIDRDNEEVVEAARTASAKLYAYACYNERYLDRYCYFSNQSGETDLGGSGKAKATKQEYFLRINESDNGYGYRYFYTLKKVDESSGMVSSFKSSFESARLRMTDKTEYLYRFEGSNIRYKSDGEHLECDWATGKDWGKLDYPPMRKGEYIAPEDIEKDIVEKSVESNRSIRGNINILAENIVKYASISRDDEGCYLIMMAIDTAVANADQPSTTMLREANGSNNCTWVSVEDPDAEGFGVDTGLRLILRLWPNGLFRTYTILERWSGTIVAFTGTAESNTFVEYSYTERDCDMTDKLAMLEEAKKAKG